MLQKLTPVPMKDVCFTDGLLAEKIRTNALVTAPLMYEKCLETGRVDVLRDWTWDGSEESRPHPFWDSDIGKMIESVAYALQTNPDQALERRIDEIVDRLEALQQPNGYLNSYFQAAEPESARFGNLYYMHELYCAGHLIEGAVAWYETTGKRKFLDVMIRYADLLVKTFLDEEEGHLGYCGHPEIELALVRLYRATGNRRYLELAKCFIDRRGQEPYFFEQESLRRGVDTTKTANQTRHLKYFLPSRGPYAEYQAHLPVRRQQEPVGHAVRAMYLYSGMADVANEYEDQELLEACRTFWKNVITTQYAITGGIGTASDGERFTFAYDIPNERTYNESCASVALIQWADRMLQMEADAAYADIIEQTLYNVILGSVSNDGERFFYANYLSVYPKWYRHASKALNEKMQAVRQPWFSISCCPPNICRLLGSMGARIASVSGEGIWIHQYAGCGIDASLGKEAAHLQIKTDYPWSGAVNVKLSLEKQAEGAVYLRIPGWCEAHRILVNGVLTEGKPLNGYRSLERTWCDGDEIELLLDMPAVFMQADPRVREDCGKTAIMRGPLVYCIEGADNGEELSNLAIDPDQPVICHDKALPYMPEAVCMTLKGHRLILPEQEKGKLYRRADFAKEPAYIKAIPYFLWGNREFSEMQVWVRAENI